MKQWSLSRVLLPSLLLLSCLVFPAFTEQISLKLTMPSHSFTPGCSCSLDLRIWNTTGQVYTGGQLYLALDLGAGEYWFYPSWCHYPSDLDWVDTAILPGSYDLSIIPEFVWPAGCGSGSGQFLSAVLAEGELVSNLGSFAFSWSEEAPATPTSTATEVPTPTPSVTVPTPTPTGIPGFTYVSPGTFVMGSPTNELCRYSGETRHVVTLTKPFYIQTTEVTQEQWAAVFGENPSSFRGPTLPVDSVSWYDCCIYCNRRSQAEGLRPCYFANAIFTKVFDKDPPAESGSVYWDRSASGYRLPTEAEWEYACRAGTTTAYNSGADNTDCEVDPNLDPLAWYQNTSPNGTHPVGEKQANNWGLYDMHGNVFEWCWDWAGAYPAGPLTDPTGPASGDNRVVRSGGYGYHAESCRSASRGCSWPPGNASYFGFRVVRSAL